MEYMTERKVSHREWDEVTIEAKQLFDNLNALDSVAKAKIDEDADFSELVSYPTLNFQNGSIHVDEMWGINESGKVWSSSFASGVLEWSSKKRDYVESFHFSERLMGDFVSISFTAGEDEKEWLRSLETPND